MGTEHADRGEGGKVVSAEPRVEEPAVKEGVRPRDPRDLARLWDELARIREDIRETRRDVEELKQRLGTCENGMGHDDLEGRIGDLQDRVEALESPEDE